MSKLDYIANLLCRYKTPLISLFAFVDSRSKISPKAKVNRFARIRKSNIGDYTYIGPSTRVESADIGKFCSVSWNCCIGLNSHSLSNISTSPIFTEKNNGTGTTWLISEPEKEPPNRTLIGSDVWIGANAIILEGLKIGDGAVIGAGAVVTKDVAPYSIVAGVPARLIGQRFSEDIIIGLLKKRWWDAPEKEIKEKIWLFQKSTPNSDDIEMLPSGMK